LLSQVINNEVADIYAFHFNGGDSLKFGDVVTAVASSVVVMVLIHFPLMIVLIPALGAFWGINVSAIISVLLSALTVGYVFATKIWEESRMEAIAKITVLAALLMAFGVVMEVAALAHWTTWVTDMYLEANPGASLSAFEWYVVEAIYLSSQMFLNVVIVLVLGFVRLYVGSMFKRPAKS